MVCRDKGQYMRERGHIGLLAELSLQEQKLLQNMTYKLCHLGFSKGCFQILHQPLKLEPNNGTFNNNYFFFCELLSCLAMHWPTVARVWALTITFSRGRGQIYTVFSVTYVGGKSKPVAGWLQIREDST